MEDSSQWLIALAIGVLIAALLAWFNKSGSDFAISISGIAGPSGGTEEKPVGTVCFGIGSINNINCHTKYFEGDRNQVRQQSVTFALKEILICLQK